MRYTTRITSGYRQLYVLYLGREVLDVGVIRPGTRINVAMESKPGFTAEGTVNPNGALSGMARVYRWLDLRVDDTVAFEVTSPSLILITSVHRQNSPTATPTAQVNLVQAPADQYESVFRRQRLRPIHIELFSPENLNRWEPENEPDVYMAFGVLQEYTRFRYCCATSQSLLTRLGFMAQIKPDAILVDDDTGEYLVAEFKMISSSFALNHQVDDVDVLIVWDDDATDRTKLPRTVLSLREIARTAAQEANKGLECAPAKNR